MECKFDAFFWKQNLNKYLMRGGGNGGYDVDDYDNDHAENEQSDFGAATMPQRFLLSQPSKSR